MIPLPPRLKEVLEGRRRFVNFDCPQCGRKGKAFCYADKKLVRCNVCALSSPAKEIYGEAADTLPSKVAPTPVKLRDFDAWVVQNRGRGLDDASLAELERRLPHIPPDAYLPLFFSLRRGPDKRARRDYEQDLYQFGMGLHSHADGRVVSYQRYSLTLPKASRRQKMSARDAPYGEAGAAFISTRILAAKAMELPAPRVALVEGMFDTATLRGLGILVQGVAGVGQAAKAIEALKVHGFVGRIDLAFDDDAGGQLAIETCGKKFRADPDILLYDARPRAELLPELYESAPQKTDINDVYRFYAQLGGLSKGFDAIARVLDGGACIGGIENAERRRWYLRVEDLRRRGLYVAPRPLDNESRRLLYQVCRSEQKKGPLRKLVKAAHCCDASLATATYDDQQPDADPGIKDSYKAAENNVCVHCMASWWDHVFVPMVDKAWPEKVWVAEVPFQDHAEHDQLRRRISARLKSSVTPNLAMAVDPIASKLYVFIADRSARPTPQAQDAAPASLRRVKEASRVTLMTREQALDGPLRAGWFSAAEYLRERLQGAMSEALEPEDIKARFDADPWLTTRFHRMTFRKGGRLELPPLGQIKHRYMEILREMRKIDEEKAEKAPEAEAEDAAPKSITAIKLHLVVLTALQKIVYMSTAPTARANISKFALGEEVKVRLGVEPNYLEDVRTWPHELERLRILPLRVAMDYARSKGWRYVVVAFGDREETYQVNPRRSREEWEEELLELNERGFDPRRHDRHNYSGPDHVPKRE